MRKSVIVFVLLMLTVRSPQRVEAGAFATEVTQALNHAQLVLQYIRQGVQLANEIQMYSDMVKNSRRLSAHNFGAILNDLNALANIVQGGRALAYSLGNLDQIFRQTYPGYGYNAGAYYTSIAIGPRPRSIPPWAHFARLGCKDSNFRASRRY